MRVSRRCCSSSRTSRASCRTRIDRGSTRASRGSCCPRSRPGRRPRQRTGARGGVAMAEQKKKKNKPTKPADGDAAGAGSPELAKKGKKLKEDLDNLLDEIDEILEENAEEFVKSYVQRGGQSAT